MSSAASATPPTWDPAQYLRHSGHRTRPFLDLLARIPEPPRSRAGETVRPLRIADIGCGAGNVTALLAGRWPDALITGFDNSPEMVAHARTAHGGPTPGGGRLDFEEGDALEWTPDGPYDLIVSNAVLHWVPGHTALLGRWAAALAPGGVLAFQVPGNFAAPSHTLVAALAADPRWRDRVGDHGVVASVREPAEYLTRLVELGLTADVWETTYLQLLTGDDPVLDWIKGTVLRPLLTELGEDRAAADAFLGELAEGLRAAYPPGPAGTVFPFRRIFAVAERAGTR
ncbi:trans-aconitate 2-methyltransferase [Streptomyces yaizuensis]|uniref:Trans-aconitate 2-methyltransferase n=1 Tax=Streptomyces yaizuensis TaxID=2989713 RepID=A0ABQ5P9Z0_9ACTN|nr:trans-aconitate 2-methyltransferase [Streptomyces sp. YSPA8]GLF99387.1 methyltransferase domain-containing protein [Streptomyces sp. YSPA8]